MTAVEVVRSALSLFGFVLASQAMEVTPKWVVDGTIVQREGIEYRMEAKPAVHEIQVLAPKGATSLPSTLTLEIKRNRRMWDQFKLKLDSADPEHLRYIGIVPASVFIMGGLTFELR